MRAGGGVCVCLFIYGMHEMFNVVTGPKGTQAVPGAGGGGVGGSRGAGIFQPGRFAKGWGLNAGSMGGFDGGGDVGMMGGRRGSLRGADWGGLFGGVEA